MVQPLPGTTDKTPVGKKEYGGMAARSAKGASPQKAEKKVGKASKPDAPGLKDYVRIASMSVS